MATGATGSLSAAVALLRLGRIGRVEEESFIIEVSDDGVTHERPVCLRDHADDESAVLAEDHDEASVVIEDDITLQDCEEVEAVGNGVDQLPPPPRWSPGSTGPRRLMQARAQQCVVCMEDKEHTFVPPHREECSTSHVDGHRFCTDCWVEYLYHCSRQPRRRGFGVSPLACPLCRGAIHVPDVWGAAYELPACWLAEEASAPDATPQTCPASDDESGEEPVHLWAEAAPGAAACEKMVAVAAAPARRPRAGAALAFA